MRNLDTYIKEAFKLRSSTRKIYTPETAKELKEIIDKKYKCRNCFHVDCTDIDVSNITDMHINDDGSRGVFSTCVNAEVIDITGWDTSNVLDMRTMFCYCNNLVEIKGIEDIDISNVRNMSCMFWDCKSLPSLDTSKWDMRNVETIDYMFEYCLELKEIKGIEDWKLNNLHNLIGVFAHGCPIERPEWYNKAWEKIKK